MPSKHWDNRHQRIYDAARAALAQSPYANSTKELQKAWIMGWLIDHLARDYNANWDLKARIKALLDRR